MAVSFVGRCECLVIALNAAQETKYKLKNGKAKGQTKEVFLVENDYVVKTKRTSNKGDGQASKFVITNLITDIIFCLRDIHKALLQK